jgi:hypothetical protein
MKASGFSAADARAYRTLPAGTSLRENSTLRLRYQMRAPPPKTKAVTNSTKSRLNWDLTGAVVAFQTADCQRENRAGYEPRQRILAANAPSVPSRNGNAPQVPSSPHSGWSARKDSTCPRFSSRSIEQVE